MRNELKNDANRLLTIGREVHLKKRIGRFSFVLTRVPDKYKDLGYQFSKASSRLKFMALMEDWDIDRIKKEMSLLN